MSFINYFGQYVDTSSLSKKYLNLSYNICKFSNKVYLNIENDV